MLLLFSLSLVGVVLYFGFSWRVIDLFVLPMMAIGGYAIYTLFVQINKQEEEMLQKQVKNLGEEMEAEKWMKSSLRPKMISYAKKRRFVISAYTSLFFGVVFFLWIYLNKGFETATLYLVYLFILFWSFIFYFSKINILTAKFRRFFLFSFWSITLGDWGRAYFLLFPIAFLIYITFPPDNLFKDIVNRLSQIPIFFTTYSFSFLGLYSVMYLYNELQKDEEENRRQKIRERL